MEPRIADLIDRAALVVDSLSSTAALRNADGDCLLCEHPAKTMLDHDKTCGWLLAHQFDFADLVALHRLAGVLHYTPAGDR